MAVAHKFEERARTNDVVISESVDFTSLMLSKPVLNGLKNAGFERPSPIQLKAIPLGRCGLDLIVQAKSGTGKTCVFSVVALEGIEPSASSTQVLVLAPTREIALQIWEVMCSLGSAMATLRCHTFIGGMPVHEDRKKLQLCHIAVGTPGRIQSLIDQGLLKTQSIRLFVLDEADKLLEEGFQPQINWIYSALPDNKQMLALSATYPEYLANHLTLYMRNPTFVRLNITDPALLGIKQYYSTVPSHPLPHRQFEAKTAAVVSLLSSITFNQCLIFSNWQTRAQNLQNELSGQGWPTSCIAGCLEQKDRITAITQLKTYSCRVLISTDLTSRGIDADRVNLVINLDVPGDQETYLHRIGRAGRFGSYGAGVTIVSEGQELIDLHKIEHSIGTHILPLPDPVPNDLVNRQLPVRLEDVVSTEQIFTQPRSDNPRPEHTGQSEEVKKAAQMVRRSDHHSLLSDDSQEDTVQVAVSAECRQQIVPLSAGTGSVQQPSRGTDRVNVSEDGDSTVLSEPDKGVQGSRPSPLYTACAGRESRDGARTGGDVETQCGNGARSRWCGGEVGSAPAAGREAETAECCPDSSRIMVSPGQKTKDNDLSVDSRGPETASAPVSVDVEDKETFRRPLENCCVNGELGAGAHEADGLVSTDGTYPCLVNNTPSGGRKGILVGACVESARLDSGDGPSVLPPSLATECCGLADAKQTAADPADTGSSSAHTTHVQSTQQEEGVVHKSCVISQAALSDQQPPEALGSALEDLRHNTYNGDISTAGSNEDKHILENDKICQSLGQNHISLHTKHVDISGSTPVSKSALDGSASPGASARQRGEGAECSDCPAGSAWGQNSMNKSTKMEEVGESTARNGMKNKKTRAVGDLWASMLKDDQDYVPRSPQHNTSLLETSADLQDSPRLKDTTQPGRKDVSWETELAMYVAVRSKMGSFPANRDKGDDEENEDEESRTEMRSRVHRPVSQAKRRLPKSACTGDHKNQSGRAEGGQTAVRSLCGPDEEHVTRNAPKHSLTPAMSPDQQTRTAPCVKGLGPEPSPMTTTERHEIKSTMQNSQAIGKAGVSDNPTAHRLEQSDSTGIFLKDNLVERNYVPPPKISMFFQRRAERKAVPLTYGSALHHYLQCLEESSLPAVKTVDALVQQTFTASSTRDQEQHQQLLRFLTHFRTQPGAKGRVCSTQGLGVETKAAGDAKQRALEAPGNANAVFVKATSVPEGAGDTMTGNTTEEKSVVPTFIADNKSVIIKEENSFTPKSGTVTTTSSGSGNKSLFSVTKGAGREKTVGRNVRAPRYHPMAVCGLATAHLFQEGASSSQRTAAGSPTDLHSSVASSSQRMAAGSPTDLHSSVASSSQRTAAGSPTDLHSSVASSSQRVAAGSPTDLHSSVASSSQRTAAGSPTDLHSSVASSSQRTAAGSPTDLHSSVASSSQRTAAGSPTDLHSSVASSSEEAAAAAMVPCQMTSDVATLPQGVAASEVTAGIAELCRPESSGQNTADRSTSSNASSEHGRPVPRLQSEVDVNDHTVSKAPSEHDRPVPKTQTSAGISAVCQEDTVRRRAVSRAQTSATLPSVSPVERGAIPRQTHARRAGVCSMGKGAIPKHHNTRAQAVWDSSADSSCDSSSSSSSTSSAGEHLKMPEGEAKGWMCFQNQYAVESCAQRHGKKRGTRAGVKKGQEEQPRHQTPLSSSREKRPEKKDARQKMSSAVSKGKGAETNHSAPFNELYGYPQQMTVQSAAYWPHNVRSSSNQSYACPPLSPYPSNSWLSYYSPLSLYSLYHGGKSVQEKTNGYHSYLEYDLQEQTAPNSLPFSQPQGNQGSHYHSTQSLGGYAFPSFQATSPFAHLPSTQYHGCPCHDSCHRAVCHCCPSQRMHGGCDQQYCHAGRSHQPAVHCVWQRSQACASMPAGSPCVAASAESQSLRHAARAHSMQRYIRSMARFYARVCTRDA